MIATLAEWQAPSEGAVRVAPCRSRLVLARAGCMRTCLRAQGHITASVAVLDHAEFGAVDAASAAGALGAAGWALRARDDDIVARRPAWVSRIRDPDLVIRPGLAALHVHPPDLFPGGCRRGIWIYSSSRWQCPMRPIAVSDESWICGGGRFLRCRTAMDHALAYLVSRAVAVAAPSSNTPSLAHRQAARVLFCPASERLRGHSRNQ